MSNPDNLDYTGRDALIKNELALSYHLEIIEKRALVVSNDISKYRDLVIKLQDTMTDKNFHELVENCNEIQRTAYRTFFWSKVFLAEKRTVIGENEVESLTDNIETLHRSMEKLSNRERYKNRADGMPVNSYRNSTSRHIKNMQDALQIVLTCVADRKSLTNG